MSEIADPGTDTYTMAELMAVIIARSMAGEAEITSGGGANQIVPLAASRLAQVAAAPNLWLFAAGAGVYNSEFDSIPLGTWDPRLKRRAECKIHIADVVDGGTSGHEDKTAEQAGAGFGGMQVDRYGNTNMIGIGEHPNLTVRGPGTVGTIWLGAGANNIYIEHHNERILVEEVDHRSGAGWLEGGDSRYDVLNGREGPQRVWTPICVCDFTEDEHRMRLASVHPGYDVDDVVAHTGFELVIPEEVPQTTPPTEAELDILRSQVDSTGRLQEKEMTVGL